VGGNPPTTAYLGAGAGDNGEGGGGPSLIAEGRLVAAFLLYLSGVFGGGVMDVNTKIRTYLVTLYTASAESDVTSLVQRYLDAGGEDKSAVMATLIAAALA
jgi:hypothetical protein